MAALAAAALAGCGQTVPSGSAQSAGNRSTPSTATSSTATSAPAHPSSATTPGARRRGVGQSHGGLAYSTASAMTVQPQPPPGACHALGSGLYSRPDPRCTPGALDPAVTQENIGQTICQRGWTSAVRPPESVTEAEKAASMAAYGDRGAMSDYEYDHFVPLELGGAVNDPRNLWPEPGASPNPKDAVEDYLNAKVCDGQMTLAQAQRAIAANWIALAGAASAPPATGAQCSLSASYSDSYHDYDVYVRSNQPDQTVTVTDAAGRLASWHTDASGYADVYFRASANAAGEIVTAHVGDASCQTTL